MPAAEHAPATRGRVTLRRVTSGIAWDWTEAARGALSALPGAAIVLVDVGAGMVAALGSVVVAMLGVPPSRRDRPRLVLVGVAFAAAYALGSIVVRWEVAAVAALTALAVAAVLLAARMPAGRLLPPLLLPGFALGMNVPAPDGFALAGIFAAGSLWATLVACAWPERPPPAAAPVRSAPGRPPIAVHTYAILLAAAAGIGLTLGFVLDLHHVAWAAAAAIFIMRPDPGLLESRALARTVATFAGVVVAGLIVRRGPTEVGLALVTLGAVAAMVAARSSRWYVTSAGTGLVVLLASGAAGEDVFAATFVERLGETALGAALALCFGVAVPFALRGAAGGQARA